MIEPWRGCKDEWSSHLAAAAAAALEPIPVDAAQGGTPSRHQCWRRCTSRPHPFWPYTKNVRLSLFITMTHYSRGEIVSVITSTLATKNLLITQQLASENPPQFTSLRTTETSTLESENNNQADALRGRKSFQRGDDYVNRSPRRTVSFWSCWEPAPAKSFTVGWGAVELSDFRPWSRI